MAMNFGTGRALMILLALISISLLVIGQTLLKHGLIQIGGVQFIGGEFWANFQKLLSTPFVFLGMVFYAASAVLWFDVLSKLEFSKAFPLVSLSYVLSLIIGYFVFKEAVGLWRVLGVATIVVGVYLVARS